MLYNNRQLKLIVIFFNLFICVSISSFARTVHLAGLVIDAENFKPIQFANIYNDTNTLLGSTNENGYYNININVNDTGDIYFNIRIIKKGFKLFSDKEHWGNLSYTNGVVMYFGMQQEQSNAASFSDFGANKNSSLNYDNVLSGFENVKSNKEFEKRLAAAKKGNNNILFKIDNEYYIADNTGWIKINSDEDVILINKKKEIAAKALNSVIKRTDIKSMTPINSGSAKFEIDTR